MTAFIAAPAQPLAADVPYSAVNTPGSYCELLGHVLAHALHC
jgi:hypothetical protein